MANGASAISFVERPQAPGAYTPKICDRYNEILRLHIALFWPGRRSAGALAGATGNPARQDHPQDLKPAQIAAWRTAVTAHSYRGRRVCPATLHQVDKVLRLGLERAARLEVIPRNPATGVDRPKVPRKEIAILTPAQLDDLFGRLAQDPREPIGRLGALAVVAAHTGARLGEITAARWSDLDLAAGSWQVQRSVREDDTGLMAVPCKTERSRQCGRGGAPARLTRFPFVKNPTPEGGSPARVFLCPGLTTRGRWLAALCRAALPSASWCFDTNFGTNCPSIGAQCLPPDCAIRPDRIIRSLPELLLQPRIYRAVTAWTSIRNGAYTSRSTISKVLGG